MNPGATAATAAAAAAAAQRRKEEEQMTPYDREDLAEDWEFKILRSALGTFKKPELMAEILKDEARAGWVLVEKFDDQRLRLKRPAAAKERDRGLDFDPYRTTAPGDARRLTRVLLLCAVFGLSFAAILIFIVTR